MVTARWYAVRWLTDGTAERGILDRPARGAAGPHQVGAAGVVGLLGVHGADDGQPLHLLGELRQVLGDPDAGHAGGRLLERAAVLVPGLEVEGVHLAGPA